MYIYIYIGSAVVRACTKGQKEELALELLDELLASGIKESNYLGTVYGLRFSTEIYGSKREKLFSTKAYRNLFCSYVNLGKSPGIHRRM